MKSLFAISLALVAQDVDATNARNRAIASAFLSEIRTNPPAKSHLLAADAHFSIVADNRTIASSAAGFGEAIKNCVADKVSASPVFNDPSMSEVSVDWTCRGNKQLYVTMLVKDGTILSIDWGSFPFILAPGAG